MALCLFLRTPTGHFHHPGPCDNAPRALGQAPCDAVVREVCASMHQNRRDPRGCSDHGSECFTLGLGS